MWSENGLAAGRETRWFRPAAGPNFDQYWSELMMTPSFLASIAIQTR